jgi:hypothetical protein
VLCLEQLQKSPCLSPYSKSRDSEKTHSNRVLIPALSVFTPYFPTSGPFSCRRREPLPDSCVISACALARSRPSPARTLPCTARAELAARPPNRASRPELTAARAHEFVASSAAQRPYAPPSTAMGKLRERRLPELPSASDRPPLCPTELEPLGPPRRRASRGGSGAPRPPRRRQIRGADSGEATDSGVVL